MATHEDDVKSALVEPSPETKDFFFQQTMLRIKDPKASLKFYSEVLGMRLLKRLDFATMKFTLYFFGYENAADIPEDETERTKWCLSRRATLELTHNWGSQDKEGSIYHDGNSDPQGFGHIGIAVPDVEIACKRFEELSVEFIKKPADGKMKGIAFIKDPDGYWIEIVDAPKIAAIELEFKQ